MSGVAVLGATGAVGRSTIAELTRWGVTGLRLGARRPGAVDSAGLPDDTEIAPVRWDDPDSLARFCAGRTVVVNCAGPAHLIGDRVARAALAAGAHYVDPGGEDLLDRLPASADRRVLVAAGMLPGLSALLPRLLAREFDRPVSLLAYVGGIDRFTAGAAGDYLASLRNGFGRPMTWWRHGRAVPAEPIGPAPVEVPGFPGPVSVHPYLSAETERLAGGLGLEEVRWHNVFGGTRVPAALAVAALGEPDPGAVDDLIAAAERDLIGAEPYQLFVMRLDGYIGQTWDSRTSVSRAADGYRLTAFVTALAVDAVLRELVPPGRWWTGETLDLDHVAHRLADTESIGFHDVRPGTVAVADAVEEGSL